MLEISIDMRKTNAYNKSVNCLRVYHTINCVSRQERARQQHIGGGSMAERYTKTYVSVNVDIDEDGTMLPRLIRWMNGRVFAIEQLGYKCRASSAKVGGGDNMQPVWRFVQRFHLLCQD